MIRRREFIILLGGAAVALPMAARAQQAAMPVIGFLSSGSAEDEYFANLVRAFRLGLRDAGFVEGRNLAIDFRWAEGRYNRLPGLADELVRRQVAVIFAGGPPPARAAKAATAAIPIVFTTGDDPVKEGLVASINQPGGNATGINVIAMELEAKRVGLLHELVSPGAKIAVLLNPNNPSFETQSKDLHIAARALGRQIIPLSASKEDEIDAAFGTLVREGAGALSVGADPFFIFRRNQLIALAARHAIPAIYEFREFAAAGGLMSYSISITGAYRQAGVFVSRILKGEKPADLPVMQPTKIELVINMKTAKALALNIPDRLLALADEVIE